ncbi:hypothetical protein BS47DRAFT_1402726 [Hydnum rufescens UP504]|uniref:Uncharacterized protein n=1 Tax=Hydnum rufescens UP504 TaxID=1448309 RepID=A0A9P6AC76_9AGAM|nr:hypothetical protein BS47DRAFT_1402726 [Hydnum rufescens UP504]
MFSTVSVFLSTIEISGGSDADDITVIHVMVMMSSAFRSPNNSIVDKYTEDGGKSRECNVGKNTKRGCLHSVNTSKHKYRGDSNIEGVGRLHHIPTANPLIISDRLA